MTMTRPQRVRDNNFSSTVRQLASMSGCHPPRRGAMVQRILGLLLGCLSLSAALWYFTATPASVIPVEEVNTSEVLTLQVHGDLKIQVVSDLHGMCFMRLSCFIGSLLNVVSCSVCYCYYQWNSTNLLTKSP